MGLPAARKQLPSRHESKLMGIDVFSLAGGRSDGSTALVSHGNKFNSYQQSWPVSRNPLEGGKRRRGGAIVPRLAIRLWRRREAGFDRSHHMVSQGRRSRVCCRPDELGALLRKRLRRPSGLRRSHQMVSQSGGPSGSQRRERTRSFIRERSRGPER